ncbi:DUF4249 family protein [Paraflavitalea speifideaquila]|uniref:DUF4249 family protein n=1 Tax=Paraflavitalea speifideaquila TaxID=3076558 RepID=UPI0028F168BA|nr:DUF4249 family protein [Paraflavitalea speifideiaquila]
MSVKSFPYHFFCKAATGSLWLIGLLLVTQTSCKKGFTSHQFEDDHLVVLAEISAADSAKIPVGKTIKVGNGGLIRFEKVNDATVTLTEDKTHTWVLQPNYGWQFAANPTTVFTNRKRYKSNTHYSIEVKHPTMGIVTASTFIPPFPKWAFVDTGTEMYQGKKVLAVTLSVQDPADKDDYYIVEVVKELLKPGRYFYYRGYDMIIIPHKGKTCMNRSRIPRGTSVERFGIHQQIFTAGALYPRCQY